MRDLNEPAPMTQGAFEAMLRRWLLKVSIRYAPLAAIGLAVLLIVVFVPTKQPNSGFPTAAGNVSTGSAGVSGKPAGSAAATAAIGGSGSPAQAAGSATPAASAGNVVAADSAAPGSVSPSVGANQSAAPSGGGSTSSGPIATPSSTGVARTGVSCGPGVRQFTWSAYAPDCIAAYHGNNGGATSPGVTPTTITLTLRVPNSAQQAAINSLAGASNVNLNDFIADLQSYIKYFNTQYELYGRTVVLKTYQGQGDYIEEDQGQGLGATQADAVTAHDMGAFGDITFSLMASQPYEEDLAAEHVIGFSSVGLSQQWFEQHAPYEYSVQGPSGTTSITETSALVCRRMAGMPAIYAGSATFQHSNRVFGIIYPQTPVYQSEINQLQQQLAACHVSVAKTIGYSINVAAYQQEASSAMAQMNAAHVSTLLCACDPIADIFLANAANLQGYTPEWLASYFGDPIARSYNQSEWDHVMSAGFEWPDYTTTEPYKVFERAYPGKQPAETPPSSPRYYYAAYYPLLQIFDALQAAGPDLTPATFEQGMFSLPPSNPGDFIGGQWKFGPNVFDPVVSYALTWWNPNAVSKFDGTKGAYQWCDGGQQYTVSDPAALGGPGQQLSCFGH